MDPVNKWLLTTIAFMCGVLGLLWYKAGSDRYSMQVMQSELFPNYAVVYVLDTKSGDVKGQMVAEDEFLYNDKPRNTAKEVFTIDPPNRYGYRQ